ncbi:hypothetical protein ABT097_27660 [Streptomyces sp. NPDC002225]|uniref:hypothetical protein n=1 Tax=Streptomyces sp. NPDC002225 TaxID=3154413 RepID=UPI00331CE235
MSRTQWYCLTAVLAVVLGLFCGPGRADAGTTTAPAVAGMTAPATAHPADPDVRAGAHLTEPDVRVATRSTGPAVPAAAHLAGPDVQVAAHPADPDAPVAASDSDRRPTPGCGRTRKHDDTPALPGRSHSAYDQAPGLAGWGLPVAVGEAAARPPARLGQRAPVAAAPTPVELSVLRV